MRLPPDPLRNRGLAFRLSLLILACTTAVFLGAFAYYYQSSRQAILKEARGNAGNLTLASARRIESALSPVEVVPELLAFTYGKRPPLAAGIREDLTGFVLFNPAVFGSCVAFAPGSGAPAGPGAVYAFRDGGGLSFTDLAQAYDYTVADWFLIPRELRRPLWSEPYFDEGGGGVVMATYSAPFFREEDGRRRFAGVVTADISLEWLKDYLGAVSIYRTGYAFLLSRDGVYLAHPDRARIMRESIFSIAEAMGLPELRLIGQRMISGEAGYVELPAQVIGRPARLCFAPVGRTGWSVGLVIPEDELFEELEALGRRVAGIGVAGFALLALVVTLVSTSITRPLKALAGRTAEIAKGRLDTPVPAPSSGDEVGQLARSFEEMRLALKEYIANLTQTTKAKERMESELKIARTIQMSFLPKRFPPFPDIPSFDLHARLEPAFEVGGDLFDFFLLEDGRLLFLVGDVSGKGVPAALFMAVTKTLVKGIAEQESTPSAILDRVNRELIKDNEAMLFVTMFLAILDHRTGELAYSNAGHNPPVLVRGGAASWVELPKGLFLGVMEEAVYRDAAITLEPGDRLLAYTDGVTEAMDESGALYSSERLLELAPELGSLDPEQACEAVAASVRGYAGKAAQADDITLLALLYRGR